jgi:hypothetical protein
VHTIHIEALYEKGLELGWRARALSERAEPHQLMHTLYPIIVGLFRLGRWDELSAIVDEHAAAYAREPASACQFVRDGPVIGAIVAAHQGDLARCDTLARLVPDPSDDPANASAWQSHLATVLGDAAAAIRLSAPKANEGRLYGPQHVLALLEAVLEQRSWADLDTVIDDARAATAGNRLLIPCIVRAAGLHHASAGRTRPAVDALADAVELFEALQVPFEAARTREQLAALQSDAAALEPLRAARGTYARLGARPAEARLNHRLARLEPR